MYFLRERLVMCAEILESRICTRIRTSRRMVFIRDDFAALRGMIKLAGCFEN